MQKALGLDCLYQPNLLLQVNKFVVDLLQKCLFLFYLISAKFYFSSVELNALFNGLPWANKTVILKAPIQKLSNGPLQRALLFLDCFLLHHSSLHQLQLFLFANLLNPLVIPLTLQSFNFLVNLIDFLLEFFDLILLGLLLFRGFYVNKLCDVFMILLGKLIRDESEENTSTSFAFNKRAVVNERHWLFQLKISHFEIRNHIKSITSPSGSFHFINYYPNIWSQIKFQTLRFLALQPFKLTPCTSLCRALLDKNLLFSNYKQDGRSFTKGDSKGLTKIKTQVGNFLQRVTHYWSFSKKLKQKQSKTENIRIAVVDALLKCFFGDQSVFFQDLFQTWTLTLLQPNVHLAVSSQRFQGDGSVVMIICMYGLQLHQQLPSHMPEAFLSQFKHNKSTV